MMSKLRGITDLASTKYRRESELLASSQDPDRTYVQEITFEKIRLHKGLKGGMGPTFSTAMEAFGVAT